jgi:hypothetical protein
MSEIEKVLLPPMSEAELAAVDRMVTGGESIGPAPLDLDPVSYARVNSKRVDAENAYWATDSTVPLDLLTGGVEGVELVFVECALLRPCGECTHSSGQLDGETCRRCGGTGMVEVEGIHIGRNQSPGGGSSLEQVIQLLKKTPCQP